MMDNAPITSPDPTASGLTPLELEEVRARRASLRRAAAGVVQVLQTPPDGGGPRAGAVLAAVANLALVWRRHAAETESPDGVLEQIVEDCPRLAGAVDRLRAEHGQVASALDEVERQLTALAPAAPLTGAPPALARLLEQVERHRRAGRELIYSAYDVDLGLGE